MYRIVKCVHFRFRSGLIVVLLIFAHYKTKCNIGNPIFRYQLTEQMSMTISCVYVPDCDVWNTKSELSRTVLIGDRANATSFAIDRCILPIPRCYLRVYVRDPAFPTFLQNTVYCKERCIVQKCNTF